MAALVRSVIYSQAVILLCTDKILSRPILPSLFSYIDIYYYRCALIRLVIVYLRSVIKGNWS